jgi:hypothetical protein
VRGSSQAYVKEEPSDSTDSAERLDHTILKVRSVPRTANEIGVFPKVIGEEILTYWLRDALITHFKTPPVILKTVGFGYRYGFGHGVHDPGLFTTYLPDRLWASYSDERGDINISESTRADEVSVAMETAKSAVRNAFESLDPEQAATKIETIANEIESVRSLIEARLQRLLPKLPAVALSESVPKWLPKEIVTVSASEAPLPETVESTVLLARAICQHTKSFMPTEINVESRGSVEWIWSSKKPLVWRIFASPLRWPGVNVRAFYADESGRPTARTFRYAGSMIRHMEGYLEE